MMRHHRLLLALIMSAGAAIAAAACSKSDSTPSGSSCSVTLGSVTTNVSAGATTGTIPVTAASSCAWSAASSASFLSVTSGASGTGNGSVGFSIAANTGAARSGSITVNGTAINFSQAAAATVAPAGCAVTLSSTNVKINSGGGSTDVLVTAASSCSWTATSNSASFTASANASGNGTVTISAPANVSSSSRTGTVTIGGQTVNVTQDPGVFAGFNLFDPAQNTSATNVCAFRSATGGSTTCTLRSTSFSQGTGAIVMFTWTVQYTYGVVKVINSTSSDPSLTFRDQCGVANAGATDEGALQPLDVTLTVTDALGNTATATSGQGNQPKLFVQLFNCDK